MNIPFFALIAATSILIFGTTDAYSQPQSDEGIQLGKIRSRLSSSGSQWVEGRGRSCAQACEAAGEIAIYSGTYTDNGSPYYICRGNVIGNNNVYEGNRAGYNLLPKWAAGCWVGHGGKEKEVTPYDCLCTGK